MIALKSPITINRLPVNGKAMPPITISSIDYFVTYDNSARRAMAIIKQVGRPIVLWQGDAYDAAGQFTDSEVEARLTEILGKDPAATISSLFHPHIQKAGK